MPYLHDGPSPKRERRAAPQPVNRVPGPHRYRLLFEGREPEVIVAESSSEAVALREGGTASRMPYQITDETEVEAWIARRLATRQGA